MGLMKIPANHNYTCERLQKYCFYFVTYCHGNAAAVGLLLCFRNPTVLRRFFPHSRHKSRNHSGKRRTNRLYNEKVTGKGTTI